MNVVNISKDLSGRIAVASHYALRIPRIKTIRGRRWHPDKKSFSPEGALKMCRRVIINLVILLCCVRPAYAAEGIKWVYSLSAAEQMAKEEGKLLMVVVCTRWDSASRRLEKQTFSQEKVVELSRKFICAQVGISEQEFIKEHGINRQLMTVLLRRGKEGEPEWIEVDRIPGFLPADVFGEKMQIALEGKKTYLAMKLRLEKEPENVENLKELAGKCVEQDRIPEAIGLYENLTRLDKEHRAEHLEKEEYLRATLFMQEGKLDEARQMFQSLLSKYPESEQAVKYRFDLITCQLMKNQLDEALVSLKGFLEKEPDRELAREANYRLGQVYLMSGQVEEAKKTFNLLVKEAPLGPSASGDWAEEAKEMLRTIELWPKRRSDLRLRKRVKDVVVLVPDVETFLYYLSKWDEETIFPILMADLKFSRKFLKRFQPSQVILAEAVPVGEITEELIYRALYASWGPEDIFEVKKGTREDLKRRLKERKVSPLGIVLTRGGAETLAGGLALAAGRDQLLDELPFSYPYGRTISFSQAEELRHQLRELIAGWGYDYESLLQGIDYITLAADLPYAYHWTETIDPGLYAVDDALGRDDEGELYAYVGRLLGDEEQSLFQAMSSLFLQPQEALFFNTYAVNSPPWMSFEMESPSRLLGRFIPTRHIQAEATLEKWREMLSDGNSYGLVFVNSSGGRDDWSTRQGRGASEDIPDSEPAIISFTHSGSAAEPADLDTIAGRWLANGAYIYYGAVSEPYVEAFNPPSQVVGSLLSGHTFSSSFRKNPGQSWSNPWRLWYLGDPLYHLEPDGGKRVEEEDSEKGLKADIAKYLKRIEETEGDLSAVPAAQAGEKALLRYKLARCYYYNDQLGKVIEVLDGINMENLSEKLRWELEELYLHSYYEEKDYLQVKRLFQKLLKERGARFISPDLRLLVASSLRRLAAGQVREGKPRLALTEYEDLLRFFPSSHDAEYTWERMKEVYQSLGDREGLLAFCKGMADDEGENSYLRSLARRELEILLKREP